MRHPSLLCLLTVLLVSKVASSFPVTRVHLDKVDVRQRLHDVAVIAANAYEKGKAEQVQTLGSYDFHPVPAHSSECVRVYRHDSDLSAGLMIVFRGTKLSLGAPVAASGDLIRDLQGATTLADFTNPLTHQKEPGQAGTGFQWRATNFMNKHGAWLQHEISQAIADGRRVEVLCIGHSLGAIGCQIASLELAQATAAMHPDHVKDRVVFSTFAFNPPVGVDNMVAGTYRDLAGNAGDDHRVLNAISIPRALDPVSEERFNKNSLMMDDRSLKLDAKYTKKSDVWMFKNHFLDVTLSSFDPHVAIDKVAKDVDNAITQVASNYVTNLPFLKLLSPVKATPDCGDGVIDQGEQCDDGTANVKPGVLSTPRGCVKGTCKLSSAFTSPASCPECRACSAGACTP